MNRSSKSKPISRRSLLSNLTLTAASLPLIARFVSSSTFAAADAASPAAASKRSSLKPAPFKLGVASYSLRGLQLDEAITAMHRLGMSCLGLYKAHLPWEMNPESWPSVWEAGVKKLREGNITVLSTGVVYLKNDEATMRNAFEYAKALGTPTFACSPPPDSLPLLDKFVKQYDIKAAIHNHGPEDKTYPSPNEAWQAVQPFDKRIGLCIDVGHSYRAGVDPAESIRKYRERVHDIHLKDSIAAVGEKDKPIEVGRGQIDQRGILSALVEIGYRGMVSFEFEKDANDPLPGLAESIGYVRGLLAGMGVGA